MRNSLLLFLLCCNQAFFAQQLNFNNGRTYAVVVGISDYQNEAIPDLRFADKDAMAFANFLRSPAGGALVKDHLKILINEQATVARFAIALDWLMEVASENDRVIIYFSGHGDVERRTLTQPGFLLCWDAPGRVYMAGGALALTMLQEVISTISIQNKAKVILIADACRAGKLSGSKVGGSQLTNSNLAKQYANEIKILSCQPDEYSIEGEQWGEGRGVFSYHLLDGLYGMADGNEDLNVNLKEIDRYLEDHVSKEVAPHSQNPMTIGNKMAKLTDVFPEVLEQLRGKKKGQLQIFTATESKGIEDDVLSKADSTIVEMYLAFKQTLKDKQFLEPELACADYYYVRLSSELQLKQLHSSMRRNYAAALQDDAQQVLNTMLRSGFTDQILVRAKANDIYGKYPAYLDRAAQLLGEEHYMYHLLLARKYFFEGMIQKEGRDKRLAFHKALGKQAEMAHAMIQLASSYKKEQLDSAVYYTRQAAALVPSWVEPYLVLSDFYFIKLNQYDKAEEMLQMAGQIDSTSAIVWYKKGQFYKNQRKYSLAEKWLLKTIEGTSEDICFPCAHIVLGNIYQYTKRYDEAEQQFQKALQLDSTLVYKNNSFCSPCAIYNLGLIFLRTDRYDEAEQQFQKAIHVDSNFIKAIRSLEWLYQETERFDLAEQQYRKALKIDPLNLWTLTSLGWLFWCTLRFDLAEQQYLKALSIDSLNVWTLHSLGNVYKNWGRYDKAEYYLKKCIEIDSTFYSAYSNLGGLYQTLQRWKESVLMIQKAIEYSPSSNWFSYAYLVNAYTHLPGRLEDAKKELGKALEIDPDQAYTYFFFAQLAVKKQQPESVWQYLETGLEKIIGLDELETYLMRTYLQSQPDFEKMRKEPKWEALMKKYFSEDMSD